VRLEITLPDERGTVLDTRRVLARGMELERVVELRLARQPPLRLHRLLVRHGDEQQEPMRRVVVHAGGSTRAWAASAPMTATATATAPMSASSVATRIRNGADAGTSAGAGRGETTAATRITRGRRRPERVYRHERASAAIGAALDAFGRLLLWLASVSAAAPMTAMLAALSLLGHAYVALMVPHSVVVGDLRVALLLFSQCGAGRTATCAMTSTSTGTGTGTGGGEGGGGTLQVPAAGLTVGRDSLLLVGQDAAADGVPAAAVASSGIDSGDATSLGQHEAATPLCEVRALSLLLAVDAVLLAALLRLALCGRCGRARRRAHDGRGPPDVLRDVLDRKHL
jgi:hypothetical protein